MQPLSTIPSKGSNSIFNLKKNFGKKYIDKTYLYWQYKWH
jgi:hypothetical protein